MGPRPAICRLEKHMGLGQSDQILSNTKGVCNRSHQPKIRLENVSAKSSAKIDKLIKQDWVHLGLDKKEKKELQAGLSGYIKAGKSNEKRQTSCFLRISKHWEIQHRDRFATRRYISACRQTFSHNKHPAHLLPRLPYLGRWRTWFCSFHFLICVFSLLWPSKLRSFLMEARPSSL